MNGSQPVGLKVKKNQYKVEDDGNDFRGDVMSMVIGGDDDGGFRWAFEGKGEEWQNGYRGGCQWWQRKWLHHILIMAMISW